MAAHSFHTVAGPSEGLYKEKGSKFLAFAYPVESEEDIKTRLDDLRKKYYDARHHCYAWMLGPERKQWRAADDGEPNHSAGDPILGQIRSKNLTNVLVVVVRYFGGTKLGVGGLITAYKTAAEEALSKAVMIEKQVMIDFELHFSYASTPEVMKLIKDFDLHIIDQQFGDDCTMVLRTALESKERLLEKMSLLNVTGTPIYYTLAPS